MKYELKYEDFSKDAVYPSTGDILLLHTDDGGTVIVRADVSSNALTCSKCHLSGRTGEYPHINCVRYNFRCPVSFHMYFTSIDTVLEDL